MPGRDRNVSNIGAKISGRIVGRQLTSDCVGEDLAETLAQSLHGFNLDGGLNVLDECNQFDCDNRANCFAADRRAGVQLEAG